MLDYTLRPKHRNYSVIRTNPLIRQLLLPLVPDLVVERITFKTN